MIYAVTGTPGSGKSYYTVRRIADALDRGHFVATNATMIDNFEYELARRHVVRRAFPGRVQRMAARNRDRFRVVDDLRELGRIVLGCQRCGAAPDRHGPGYCRRGHELAEGRGIGVFDEAHEWLNNRLWKDDDRPEIVDFFSQHRKLGWDIYLITQHIDSIDKQVRDRVEEHVVLRNLKRWRPFGIRVVPFNFFLAIHVWAGGPRSVRVVTRREFFLLDSRRELYHSMATFHRVQVDDADALFLPRSAEPAPADRPSGRDAAAAGAAEDRRRTAASGDGVPLP